MWAFKVDILENLDIGEVDLDNMDMDFTSWMEDDEDDDFDDSLNGRDLVIMHMIAFLIISFSDAFDIVKADGFEPTTSADTPTTASSSAPTGPTSKLPSPLASLPLYFSDSSRENGVSACLFSEVAQVVPTGSDMFEVVLFLAGTSHR